MNENFMLQPPGFITACNDPAKLKQIATDVFNDLKGRDVPGLSLKHLQLGAHYRYTDLEKCPDISLQPAGILGIFVDYDVTTDTTYLVFRKWLQTNETYNGFWPFPAIAANTAFLSLCIAIDLSFEFARQFSRPWSLPAILEKYPDVDLTDECNIQSFQRYGFEVLGFSPAIWRPPFRIFRDQHGEV